MTSVVDRYYRRIIQNIDNVRMKFDISSLLVKTKEHDSKINTNESNISDNLSKINTNVSDISDNYNISQINKKKSEFNTSLIANNRNNISYNLNKINTIEQNNSKVDNIIFNNNNVILNQSFNFNKDIHLYKLFEKIFENDFNGELDIVSNISYKYDNLENDLNRLTHLYQFYDDKDVLFYTITLDNHDFGISDVNKNILNVKDNFCLNVNNKNKIKVILSLTRINQWGSGIIDLELVNDNSINIIYKEKIDIVTKINTIDNNISSNLNTLNNIDKDLVNLRDKISSHQTDIQNINTNINDLSNSYDIKDIMIFHVVNNTNDVINKSKSKFIIFDRNIVYNLKKDSFIQLDISVSTYFSNHYINIQFSYLLLERFNDQDVLFEELKINIIGTISKHGIIENSSIIKIPYDMNSIKVKLSINLQNNQNRYEIVKVMNFDNHVYCKIFEKINQIRY